VKSVAGALGFVFGIGSNRINVYTSVPIETYDQWLEVLKSGRQASFLFIYEDADSEGSSRDLGEVKLTTEPDPFDMFNAGVTSARGARAPFSRPRPWSHGSAASRRGLSRCGLLAA
jgi:hypothetical protein